MLVVDRTHLLSKWRINQMNRRLCCKNVVRVHCSRCWALLHKVIHHVFDLLEGALVGDVSHEVHRFFCPSNLRILREQGPHISVLRLLDQASLDEPSFCANEEHNIIEASCSRNNGETRSTVNLEVFVFNSCKHVAFDRESKVLEWVFPDQEFAVTRDRCQANLRLERES